MLKIFTSLAIAALVLIQVVQPCERPTFTDAKITASKYFHLVDDPDDIKIEEPLTGCITPSEQLKDAVQISVKNQQVPILHEGAVQDMEWVHALYFEEDGIKEVKPGAFQNLPTIVTISLAKNQISEIPEGIFNNLEVRRLFLNDNRIAKIAPGAFNNMPNLKRVDLDRNKLQTWNGNWFTNTPNVHFLSVTYNEITSLPMRAFKNFKGKHEEAGKAVVITSIYLSNNKIEQIHGKAFKGLKQLDFLDLDHNNIAQLDDDVFADFDSVKYLMLEGNKITCLSAQFLEAMPSSDLIDINNNPLDCQCLKKMKAWTREHPVNLKFHIRSIECMQDRIKNLLDSVKDIN